MKSSICLLFILAYGCPIVTLFGQPCDALIQYRDGQLHKDFELASKKYSLNSQAIADARKFKSELLNHRGWNEGFSVRNSLKDGALTTAYLAKTLKMVCDLVNTSLGFYTGSALAASSVITSKKSQFIYDALSTGKSIYELSTVASEESALRAAMENGNSLMKSLAATYSFAKDIEEIANMDKDHNELREEVSRTLQLLDDAITKYETAAHDNAKQVTQINEIKKGIDLYWAKHCKLTQKKEESIAPKKKLVQKVPVVPAKQNAVTSVQPNATSIYVFFTADLTLGSSFAPRSVKIISKPVLFNGHESELPAEKARFIGRIRDKLPQLMAGQEDVRTDLASVVGGNIVRADNSEELEQQVDALVEQLSGGVKTHYNYLAENKRKLVRSQQECIGEIERYKSFTRSTLAGIGSPTEFVEL